MTNGELKAENVRRAARAAQAIGGINEYAGNDEQTKMTDLLTDLRHMADWKGVNFYEALEMSYQHYLAERRGR